MQMVNNCVSKNQNKNAQLMQIATDEGEWLRMIT